MKREVISEAMSNISEEYRAEALQLHDPEVISGQKHMKKKIITIALVAAITTALGATAFAALSGMSARDGEPGETIVANFPAESIEAVVPVGDTGETMETIVYQEADSCVYTNITKVFTFDAFTSCDEMEFKTNYAPDGFIYNWGAPDDVEEGHTFLENLNPNSLRVVTAKCEPALANTDNSQFADGIARYQFERMGYFCTDRDSTPEHPVFNRTCTLKDSWAKMK